MDGWSPIPSGPMTHPTLNRRYAALRSISALRPAGSMEMLHAADVLRPISAVLADDAPGIRAVGVIQSIPALGTQACLRDRSTNENAPAASP